MSIRTSSHTHNVKQDRVVNDASSGVKADRSTLILTEDNDNDNPAAPAMNRVFCHINPKKERKKEPNHQLKSQIADVSFEDVTR